MLEKGAANPITLSGSYSDVSNPPDAEHVSPFLALIFLISPVGSHGY